MWWISRECSCFDYGLCDGGHPDPCSCCYGVCLGGAIRLRFRRRGVGVGACAHDWENGSETCGDGASFLSSPRGAVLCERVSSLFFAFVPLRTMIRLRMEFGHVCASWTIFGALETCSFVSWKITSANYENGLTMTWPGPWEMEAIHPRSWLLSEHDD